MSAAALTWEQFRFERKLFWRNPTAAFFNFVLPLLLLFLIATAFASEGDELDVLIPGVAGMSVMATTFTALAYVLVYRREEGILKRVRGTPMPAASYLGGMIGSAVLNALLQVAARGRDRALLLRRGLAGRLAPAGGRSRCSGSSASASLGHRLRARDPERGLGPRVGQRGVPAADLHLGRLLLVRRRCPGVLKAIAEALPLKHLIDGLSAGDRRRWRGHARGRRRGRRLDRRRAAAGGALLPLVALKPQARARAAQPAPRARASPGQRSPSSAPEALGVVVHLEVRHLVLDHVVEDLRRAPAAAAS